jgi:hypothetical protein
VRRRTFGGLSVLENSPFGKVMQNSWINYAT